MGRCWVVRQQKKGKRMPAYRHSHTNYSRTTVPNTYVISVRGTLIGHCGVSCRIKLGEVLTTQDTVNWILAIAGRWLQGNGGSEQDANVRTDLA